MTAGQMLWEYQAGEKQGRTAVLALSGLQVMVVSAFGGNWQLKVSGRERDVGLHPICPGGHC